MMRIDVWFWPEISQNISERLTTTHKTGHFIVHHTHVHIPVNFYIHLLCSVLGVRDDMICVVDYAYMNGDLRVFGGKIVQNITK